MNNSTFHKGSIFVSGILLAFFLLTVPPAAFATFQKGQPAPSIKVTTASGQTVSLANYKGYVLVLDFFASWCEPCKRSIPHLIELNRKYGKQGLQILGLSLDEDREDLNQFVMPLKLNYPVALADENLQSGYGLRSIPTLVLIDKKGIVVEKYMGLTDEMRKTLEATIKRLLVE
ncbi:MAG TPA: TlpA disulfide reductase family protein [Geobacteraceae bacterium]|nr:TlpA disulfide reductase family protein [Geobacteraceae bacterium]